MFLFAHEFSTDYIGGGGGVGGGVVLQGVVWEKTTQHISAFSFLKIAV